MHALNINNHIFTFELPQIMAIINLSPDSFCQTTAGDKQKIKSAIEQAIHSGAKIIDIGACSTRPNSSPITSKEEWQRLQPALKFIREHFPDIIISIDTFRANIALESINQYNANIINDISGGEEKEMFRVISEKQIPYILTYNQAAENILQDCVAFFAEKINLLHTLRVKDIILDPGFGFNKTISQNYALLQHLDILKQFNLPILAGISHKSMLYKTTCVEPKDAELETVAANTVALLRGADILRVHNPQAAQRTIKIYNSLYGISDLH